MRRAVSAALLAALVLLTGTAPSSAPAGHLPPDTPAGTGGEGFEGRITDEGEAAEVTAVYPVELERELQAGIADICVGYSISPAVVFAVIERESGCDAYAVGDGGKAYGLMQIHPQWHGERMRRLGTADLFDPLQNAAVGIDYLAELAAEYGDLHMALVAYNAGRQGAEAGWFAVGEYESDYSRAVLARAQILTEGAVTYVG